MKFIMLINVKMPTLVGILTFIGMINTAFDSLKQSDMLFQKQSNLCADCLGLFGGRLVFVNLRTFTA